MFTSHGFRPSKRAHGSRQRTVRRREAVGRREAVRFDATQTKSATFLLSRSCKSSIVAYLPSSRKRTAVTTDTAPTPTIPFADPSDCYADLLTDAAVAYVRARNADPLCSFGDFAAMSEVVDEATAMFLKTGKLPCGLLLAAQRVDLTVCCGLRRGIGRLDRARLHPRGAGHP